MADPNKPQDDLSIEEILGSIRRIIAEDEDDVPAPVVADKKEETPSEPIASVVADDLLIEEDIEEEPLELTNKIEPDGSITDVSTPVSEPVMEDEIADDLVFQESDPVEDVIVAKEPEYAEKIILVEEPVAMHEDEPISTEALLSSSTAEATTAVMAKLARHTALLEEGSHSVGSTGPSVESIVRELLRPMLKTWLDDHLPSMVQKVVEREIERLTKRL